MKILIIDDEIRDAEIIELEIKRQRSNTNFEFIRLTCEQEFLAFLTDERTAEIDGIVLDQMLPWARGERVSLADDPRERTTAGTRLCSTLVQRNILIPVWLCSNLTSADLELDANKIKAAPWLVIGTKTQLTTSVHRFLQMLDATVSRRRIAPDELLRPY